MCGIVAYIGPKAPTRVRELLPEIEYRGYDSCGVGYYRKGKPEVFRSLDVKDIPTFNVKDSWAAVGHVRWATQGLRRLENAHPILSDEDSGNQIIVVHNGDLTNHKEIKEWYDKYGYSHCGETDTEVIANFYHYNRELLTLTAKETFEDFNKHFKGEYALVFCCKDNELELTARGRPLYYNDVGLVSSDFCLISKVGKLYSEVKDGDYQVITYNKRQRKLKYEIPPYWHIIDKSKVIIDPARVSGDLMLHEIREQALIAERVDFSLQPPLTCRRNDKLWLVGCGSSYYAARYAQTFSRKQEQTDEELEAVYALEHYCNQPSLFVSQSGESADILKATEGVDSGDRYCLTNHQESTLAKRCYHEKVIDLQAGPEKAVAATKSFTLQALSLINHWYLIHEEKALPKEAVIEFCDGVSKLVDNKEIPELSGELSLFKHILTLGIDYTYPIAQEFALKLKEVSNIHAEAIFASEVKHGPISLVDANLLSIFLIDIKDGDYETLGRLACNIAQIQARDGKVMVIACQNNLDRLPKVDYTIGVPYSAFAFIRPLIINVAGQLLSYWIAKAKGLNADRPKNIAKSVTVL